MMSLKFSWLYSISAGIQPGNKLRVAAGLMFGLGILLAGSACLNTDKEPVNVSLENNLIRGEVRWPATVESEPVYSFGFDRRLEPKEDVRIYSGLLQYLENETGYKFRLHVTPKAGSLVREILAEQVDFAIAGTLTYLQVREVSAATMLVCGLNSNGEGSYRSLIVSRPDSDLKSLRDLAGHTFAFGASNSTQGYLIPRIMMSQAGIELGDLQSHEFTRSHFETSNAVISGRVDAGAVQDTLGRTLAEQGLVRIIAQSDPFPSSGIIAGAHVPAEVADAVQQALLAFNPKRLNGLELYHWERTEMPNGFGLVVASDYDDLRHWARIYGLLQP